MIYVGYKVSVNAVGKLRMNRQIMTPNRVIKLIPYISILLRNHRTRILRVVCQNNRVPALKIIYFTRM